MFHADVLAISGLILSGVRPIWVEPQWDPDLHLAHPPAPEAFEAAFAEHPDARGAFFGRTEQVPADRAAGEIAAEMLTPYPPGIPAVLPGERITGPVLDYLRSGVRAGMVVPDAADPSLQSVRIMVAK